MADTDVKERAADADDDKTLYELVADALDVRFQDDDNEDETHDAYKGRLVLAFAGLSKEATEDLAEDVFEWLNDATRVYKSNRGAKTPKPLPYLDGLDADDEKPKTKVKTTVAKPAAKDKPKTAAKSKDKAETKTSGQRGRPASAKKSGDDQHFVVQKDIARMLKDAGFTKIKDRDPEDGKAEFSHPKQGTIYVAPSHETQTYMTTWRTKKGEWTKGVKALKEHLAD